MTKGVLTRRISALREGVEDDYFIQDLERLVSLVDLAADAEEDANQSPAKVLLTSRPGPRGRQKSGSKLRDGGPGRLERFSPTNGKLSWALKEVQEHPRTRRQLQSPWRNTQPPE